MIVGTPSTRWGRIVLPFMAPRDTARPPDSCRQGRGEEIASSRNAGSGSRTGLRSPPGPTTVRGRCPTGKRSAPGGGEGDHGQRTSGATASGWPRSWSRGASPTPTWAGPSGAIGEAAAQGCRLVVLPECLDLGWTDPSARDLARPIPGPHAERLAQAAREHRIYVAAGLVERAGDRLYNAAVLIGPEGRVLLHHRKINELDIALDLYSIGDRLGVVETELGTIGLAICADNFGSSLAIGHVLARMGAQLILSPSAWAVDADHDNDREPYGKLWLDSYARLLPS